MAPPGGSSIRVYLTARRAARSAAPRKAAKPRNTSPAYSCTLAKKPGSRAAVSPTPPGSVGGGAVALGAIGWVGGAAAAVSVAASAWTSSVALASSVARLGVGDGSPGANVRVGGGTRVGRCVGSPAGPSARRHTASHQDALTSTG
jgi:hypothetical protein